MYKEIFIALCFVAAIAAFPAENEQPQQVVEDAQIEDDGQQQGSDLEGAESRYGGWGFGRGFGHYGGGWRGFGGGYHGFGGHGWRGFGGHGHGYRYWG